MGHRVAEGVLLGLQAGVLPGVLDAGVVELLLLEAQQVELPGPLALIAAQRRQAFLDHRQLLAQCPQRLEVDGPVAVEGGALAGRGQQ